MEQIGKYKVLGELGRGGFGAVYLCEDNLNQKVAVKVFDPKDDVVAGAATSATSDAGEVLKQRFQSEAITLRKLSSNPYIVDLYDFEETEDGITYYVMPYLDHSLVDEIGKDAFSAGAIEELDPELRPRRISVNQSVKILTEILEAMRAVHREGLVHRDLKPANILFDPDGKVQVCDFGIAKLPDAEHSQSGVGMGSRNYMSKEQRESAKHVEASSDIYAIGVMAYRMLTGTLPDGRYQDPMVYAPSIGQPLNDLIIRAMSVEPTARPKDAGLFLKELKAALRTVDDAAPEDEATGTWVEQGKSSIRDELRPLRDQIEKLLLEHGEIPPSERDTLEVVAQVADLDAAGFEELVTQVTEALGPQFKSVQKFVSIVAERTSKEDFGEVDRKALLAAGTSIGWSEGKVDGLIEHKLSSQAPTESVPKPISDSAFESVKLKPQSAAGAEATASGRSAMIVAIVSVVLLGGGGYWYWDQTQQATKLEPAIDEQTTEREQQTRLNVKEIKTEQTATAKSNQTNTMAETSNARGINVASVTRYFPKSGHAWLVPLMGEQLHLGEVLRSVDETDLRFIVVRTTGNKYITYTERNLNLLPGAKVVRR